jgi:hypothetical protein
MIRMLGSNIMWINPCPIHDQSNGNTLLAWTVTWRRYDGLFVGAEGCASILKSSCSSNTAEVVFKS